MKKRIPKIELPLKRNLSLRTKIFLVFLILVLSVFLLMWIFQVIFMESFYESFKVRDTAKQAHRLVTAYGTERFSAEADEMSRQYECCIEVLDSRGRELYYQCMYNNKCLLHGESSGTYFYMKELEKSGTIIRRMHNPNLQNEMLIYGCTMYRQNGEVFGYLILNCPLVPVQSTVSILKRQTTIITLLLGFIAILLSLFTAGYISSPLGRISREAKRLAHGNYAPDFEGGGYAEIDELADTLNYVSTELAKTEEMQKDLIANVSHDLRTPLTMMKAYAEMIRDLSGDNPEKRSKHLGIIIEETDRLSALVKDMLDLSKLESGTQALELKTFDIAACMEEIVRRYSGISEQMGYRIEFTPGKSRMVTCDEGKIQRVIGNLINNAINYTSKEEKCVYVTQRDLPDCVRIEIRDTGDGIEADKIHMIFDKYYRSENHKRETVGTGLGLSIVKAILRMHGYNFGVESKLGEGSVFWFEIRAAQENQ